MGQNLRSDTKPRKLLGAHLGMVFAHIEKLKQEYTDKYVTVDEQRPELQRFGHMTGIVKTVNMNGRALVEFDGLENIGWYDIEIDFLKVVDKPVVHETTKKTPVAKAPSELEKARAADSKTTGGKTSVEDVLAEARADKPSTSGAQSKSAAKDVQSMSVEDILAAARGGEGGAKVAPSNSPTVDADDVSAVLEAARKPKSGPTAASTSAAPPNLDPKSMSVADVLAAARGNEAASPTSGQDATVEEPSSLEEAAEDISESEQEPASATEEEVETGTTVGELPTDVEGILAYCRERDGS